MLEDLLKELCEAIRDGKLKSKQACFDYFVKDLIEAKKFHSWQSITTFLNQETHDSLSIDTYRFMFKKAKSRNSEDSNNKSGKSGNNPSLVKPVIETRSSGDPEKITYDADDVAAYMKVCFGSERIASRAIDAGVSIDEIKSWKCPNQVNLGTRLSNHIQNK